MRTDHKGSSIMGLPHGRMLHGVTLHGIASACLGWQFVFLAMWTTLTYGQQPVPSMPPVPDANWQLPKEESLRIARRLDADDWATEDFGIPNSVDPIEDQPSTVPLNIPPTLDEAEPFFHSTASPEMTGWIRWMVLKNLPPTYEDKRKWGKQKEIFDGIDFEREGLRFETHRRYKKVDHGTWSRYFIEFIDPLTQLQLRMDDMTEIRPGVIRFRTEIEAPMKVYGQITRYQWNVKAYSISAQANAITKLTAVTELEIQLNPISVPPSVRLIPKVTEAKVELAEFRIVRISHMKGPVAKFLGAALREVLENKLEDYDEKLVEKMNKQLDKQKDNLHLTAEKWFSSVSKP